MRLTSAAKADLKELSVLLRTTKRACWTFAVYNTAAARAVALDALKKLLTPLPIYDFKLSSLQQNPLAYLDQLPPKAREEKAVIIFLGVERADEKTLGILETQRETFADSLHSLVFWITQRGRARLARNAPNFWAQRSGKFEFVENNKRKKGGRG